MYTSLPDFTSEYGITGYVGRYQCPKALTEHKYKVYLSTMTYKLKAVRDFVTTHNSIFTTKDVCDQLGITKKDSIGKVEYTLKFYEQTGLVSYIPNYEGDELLFTNTKHFKTLWKT